jgi:aminoglycoside phosphotransferase (APT) family kinase protein
MSADTPGGEPPVNLEACLPAELRGPTTAITRIIAGLSGAGVYRVEAAGQAFVLKIASADEPIDGWRHRTQIQQHAADAGVAPRVVHVDEARRAIVSAFVVDRSFPAFYGNPQTHEAALVQLGQTLRRVHDLPLPDGTPGRDPRELLTRIWSGPLASSALPGFVGDAVERVRGEPVPACDRAVVLSHNDVNPTNLTYNGEHVLLLDWDAAGPNDAFYDLAAIAVFLRMDDATCLRLLAAHDGAAHDSAAALPARFIYNRRLIAAMCGVVFLHLARAAGHPGATGDETLAGTPDLGELYLRMRSGELSVATGAGRWAFGLALVKASTAL